MKINRIDSKLEEIMFPLMSMSNKLVLTGTTSLHMMDIFDRTEGNHNYVKVSNDIDFSLREKLTVDEILHMKDFLELNSLGEEDGHEYILDENGDPKGLKLDENGIPVKKAYDPKETINKEIIQLIKYESDGYSVKYKVDIFNGNYLRDRNVLLVPYYDGALIQVQHPALTWAAKARLAFDTRVSQADKHSKDLEMFMKKDKAEYAIKIQSLMKLSSKIKEDKKW
jgi:hypothetical protein